jgi:hypothetical protein
MSDLNHTLGLRVSPSVRLAETQDGLVLFDPRQGLCVAVNCTGALIWKEVCAGNELNQIAEHLAEQFSIPTEQAYNDVQELLQQLKEKRLFADVRSTENKRGRPKKLGGFFRSFWKRAFAGSAKDTE